jgi:phosphate transport system permease protein
VRAAAARRANELGTSPYLRRRRRRAAIFRATTALMTLSGVVFLLLLLFQVVRDAWGWLDWQFLTSFPSRRPAVAGVKSALLGTIWMISLTALVAIPVGVGAAVYLEEYARPSRLKTFIQINIANLAGVPSIVYGILGLAMFVRFLELGRSVLAGALTMALLILPVIVIAAREAIRAVPGSLRQAAYALGATRWQTVRHHVLPVAMPGILTGVILALSRAIGEAAPLIMIGGVAYVAFVPSGPLDQFTALPIQIFNWASRPQSDFQHLAAAGILVLLAVLFVMNSVAIVLRQRAGRQR